MARAIFDSDSDSESEGGIGAKLTARPLTSNDNQDDDAVIARIRAQTVGDADSDPFTGSLSSVPRHPALRHSHRCIALERLWRRANGRCVSR